MDDTDVNQHREEILPIVPASKLPRADFKFLHHLRNKQAHGVTDILA